MTSGATSFVTGTRRTEEGSRPARSAAAAIREIHPRMPVIVSPLSYEAWLDPDAAPARALLDRLLAEAPREFTQHPVSDRVNRAAVDDAACIEPVPEAPRQESLF